MRKRRLIVITLVMLGLVLPTVSASARTVRSGTLTLTLGDSPFFVKGAQGDIDDFCAAGAPTYSSAHLREWFAATSTYPIVGWDIASFTDRAGPSPWTHYAQSAPPVLKFTADNFDSACELEGADRIYIVQVTDSHGQSAALEVGFTFNLTRWNNVDVTRSGLGFWTYRGTWTKIHCVACDGGSQTSSKARGATATFALNNTWAQDGARAAHLGLMMTKGPGHGKAALYLDGKLVTTYDTNATTVVNRLYVWDFAVRPGTHTVKVVNQGTPGRPRIDINAMGVVWGSTAPAACTPDSC